ncbi:MAG: hypothetical protein QXR98_04205 [Fervidicoccaceae archaeon]
MRESGKCREIDRRSFLVVGDIAIVNISSEEEIENARELAKCISEESPYIKAVFAKQSTEGEFRIAKLIHLHGERRTETIAKEYGLRFAVDIGRAYYNPRLTEEHRRIAMSCSDDEIILDLFSGIGGFSLHIASLKRAFIFANDWNKEAISLLLKSVLLNKKKLKGSIYATAMDALNLIQEIEGKISFDRIIMNSPTNSILYLEPAIRAAKRGGIIHLYTLQQKDFNSSELISFLGNKVALENAIEVLEYSPSKSIFRLDLRVIGPHQDQAE